MTVRETKRRLVISTGSRRPGLDDLAQELILQSDRSAGLAFFGAGWRTSVATFQEVRLLRRTVHEQQATVETADPVNEAKRPPGGRTRSNTWLMTPAPHSAGQQQPLEPGCTASSGRHRTKSHFQQLRQRYQALWANGTRWRSPPEGAADRASPAARPVPASIAGAPAARQA